MSEQDEKRIIVKVAYNYFQDGKWDLALSEYRKLAASDPMDFLVHNMMAEIYKRKNEPDMAVDEYAKAATLLYAANNIEKAIHAYNQILKLKPQHVEAREKIQELVATALLAIDKLILKGELEKAYEHCNKLSFKVIANPSVERKLAEIEKLLDEQSLGDLVPADNQAAESRSEDKQRMQQTNEELLGNLLKMGERYEEQQAWDEAVETYLTMLRVNPEDSRIKVKLNNLYRINAKPKVEQNDKNINSNRQQMVTPVEVPIDQSLLLDNENQKKKSVPKANFSATYEEMERLRQKAEERLRQAVSDRKNREQQRQTEPLPEPNDQQRVNSVPGKLQEKDVQALLTQAQMYINQHMLVEALRVCQTILEQDAGNREVRQLLKKIYDKKKFD